MGCDAAIAGEVATRIGTIRVLTKNEFQARIDGLTGMLNRRSLEDQLRALVEGSTRFTIAMVDLDHFKRLNDTYGHEGGDRALRVFSSAAHETLRAGDPIGLGGSGFRPNAEVTLSWADGRGDPVTITTDDTGGFLYQLPTRATEAVGHRTLVATSGDQLTRADVRVLRNPRVATPRPVPD